MSASARLGKFFANRRWTAPNVLTTVLIAAAFVMAPWNRLRVIPAVAYSDVLFCLAAVAAFFALQQQRSRARIPAPLLVVACLFTIPAAFDAARFGAGPVITDLTKLLIASIVFPVVIAWSLSFSSNAPRIATYGWIAGSTASALIATLNKYGHFPFGIYDSRIYWTGRYAGLTQYPNMIGLFSAFAVILLFALVLKHRGGWTWRALLLAAMLPNLYAIQLSGSRSAFIGLAAGILAAILAWPGGREKQRLLIRLAVLAPLLVGAWTGLECFNSADGSCSSPIITRLFGSEDTAVSDSIRLQLLSKAWNSFLEHPFLGLGTELGQHAHNLFLQLLVTGGLVALSGFLLYLLYFNHLFWHLRANAERRDTDIANLIGAYACTVCWLINGLFQPFITERTCYIGLGLILAHRFCAYANDKRRAPLPGSPVPALRIPAAPRTTDLQPVTDR